MRKVQSIAFCGIDGSGKSSLIKYAYEFFDEKGYKAIIDKINYSPLDKYGESKVFDLLLQLTSSVAILRHFYLQSLQYKSYDFILNDRHMLCYLAYAMAYDIKNIDLIKSVLDLINTPDLIIYFDVEIKIAFERINRRCSLNGINPASHENPQKLAIIKSNYESLLLQYSNVEIIDSNRSLLETQSQLEDILAKKYII